MAKRAFSLVEIAFALAIVSFALISLIGLMSVGMSAQAQANEETTVAAITKSVLARVMSTPYAELPSQQVLKFASDGGLVEGANPGNPPHFECLVDVTDYATVAAATPVTWSNLKRVRLTFSWPVAADVSNRRQQIFETAISKYD